MAVVGAPDPVLGETVTAVIALKSPSPAPTPETSESHMSVSSGQRAINSEDSQRVSAITADNATELLRIYLTPLLAPYKVPRSALVTSAIPRNALGKVDGSGGCGSSCIDISVYLTITRKGGGSSESRTVWSGPRGLGVTMISLFLR